MLNFNIIQDKFDQAQTLPNFEKFMDTPGVIDALTKKTHALLGKGDQGAIKQAFTHLHNSYKALLGERSAYVKLKEHFPDKHFGNQTQKICTFLRIYQRFPFFTASTLEEFLQLDPKKVIEGAMSNTPPPPESREARIIPLVKIALQKEFEGQIQNAEKDLKSCEKALRTLRNIPKQAALTAMDAGFKLEFLCKGPLKLAIGAYLRSKEQPNTKQTKNEQEFKASLKQFKTNVIEKIIDKLIDSHQLHCFVKAYVLYHETQIACKSHLVAIEAHHKDPKKDLKPTLEKVRAKEMEFGIYAMSTLQGVVKELLANPHEKELLQAFDQAICESDIQKSESFDSIDYSHQLWKRVAAPALEAFLGLSNVFSTTDYEHMSADEIADCTSTFELDRSAMNYSLEEIYDKLSSLVR